MDPFTIGAIGAPILGGIIGNIASSGDRDDANAAYAAALAQIAGIPDLDINQLKLALDQYQEAGQLSPEMEQTILQGASRMEGVSTDPKLRQAQMQQLSKLQELGSSGLNAEDRMNLNAARRDVARDAAARNASVVQNMQQRGIGGAGAELAVQLANNQAATDRMSGESDRIAAMAQQRALEAIMKSGGLAGDIRKQEFGEQADVARAADEIARMNAANRQQVIMRNVAAGNRSGEMNLANKQDIMNRNVNIRNEQQKHNKSLFADEWERKFRKASAVAQAQQARGGQHMANAQQTAQNWANMGTGVAQGAAAMTSRPTSPTNNINSGSNIQDFLDRDNTSNFKLPGRR